MDDKKNLPKKKTKIPTPSTSHLASKKANKSDSDLLVEKKPQKTSEKLPKVAPLESKESDEPKKSKPSTASMVIKALEEMKSRKGTSVYAIKKYISENYDVDADKTSLLIKKYLKTAVEKGEIVQTKGVGAAGSFKLDPKIKKTKKKISKADDAAKEPKQKNTSDKEKNVKKKVIKEIREKEEEKKKAQFSKTTKSPKKKSAIKRKSIGSIVKAPKMKPAASPKPKVKKQKAV